jgi:uncharacterized protein
MRAAGAVVLALALSGCSGMFLWPEKILIRDPSALTLAFADVRFASADGTVLHGWYLRAAGTPRGTVLFFHGNAENISTHLGFVHWLPDAGYNVMLWDYRGFGRSGGYAHLGALHEDAQAALAWLVQRSDFDREHLVLYGQSLGGSVAIRTAVESAERRHIRAVISESTFSSYRRIAREKLDMLWLTWPFQWPLSFLFGNGYAADKVVERVSPIPLLIVHGDADPVVPFAHGERLYARAREPKEFWRMEGANHISSFSTPPARARLAAWMESKLN